MVWRVCSAENGIISNTNELILSSFACFAVIMLPEIFTNRLPIFSLIGFFFTALLALLAKFGRKILKIDAVLNNSIAAIFLFGSYSSCY